MIFLQFFCIFLPSAYSKRRAAGDFCRTPFKSGVICVFSGFPPARSGERGKVCKFHGAICTSARERTDCSCVTEKFRRRNMSVDQRKTAVSGIHRRNDAAAAVDIADQIACVVLRRREFKRHAAAF